MAFVGRVAELAAAVASLTDPARRSVVIHGPPGNGKRAFLAALTARLERERDLRVVPFDLHGREHETAAETARALAGAMADRLGLPTHPELGEDPWTSLRTGWLPEILAENGEIPVFIVEGYRPGHAELLDRVLSARSGTLHDRVAVVLVLEGGISDLSLEEAALVDGMLPVRIGHLSREDTRALVGLAEGNGTLHWTAEAAERVWRLTRGHPALTHGLCAAVWKHLHPDGSKERQKVTEPVVVGVVGELRVLAEPLLRTAWERSTPACRVVASTVAGGGGLLPTDRLDEALAAAGVSLRVGWLVDVSHLIDEWDLVQCNDPEDHLRVDGALMIDWITSRHAPADVLNELREGGQAAADPLLAAAAAAHVAPAGAAHAYAVEAVRGLLATSPDQLAALELEADLLYAADLLDEATARYRALYERIPVRAAPWLARCLLDAANAATDLHLRVRGYSLALAVVPGDPEVESLLAEAWAARGQQALEAGRLVEAVEAFHTADRAVEEDAALERWRREQADAEWQAVDLLVSDGQYAEAERRLRGPLRLFRLDRPDELRILEERIRNGLNRVDDTESDAAVYSLDSPTDEVISEEAETPTSVPAAAAGASVPAGRPLTAIAAVTELVPPMVPPAATIDVVPLTALAQPDPPPDPSPAPSIAHPPLEVTVPRVAGVIPSRGVTGASVPPVTVPPATVPLTPDSTEPLGLPPPPDTLRSHPAARPVPPPPPRPPGGASPSPPASGAPRRSGRLWVVVAVVAVGAAVASWLVLPSALHTWQVSRVTFVVPAGAETRLFVDRMEVTDPARPQELAIGRHVYTLMRGAACDTRCLEGGDCPGCCATCGGDLDVTRGVPLEGVGCTPVSHPLPEVCDPAGEDEDCNGLANDADPGLTDRQSWFPDADGDGHGALGAAPKGCAGAFRNDQQGVIADLKGPVDDCDDNEPTAYPGAKEVPGNMIDEDCDGVTVYGIPGEDVVLGPDSVPTPDVPGFVTSANVDAVVHRTLKSILTCYANARVTPPPMSRPKKMRLGVYGDSFLGKVTFPPDGEAAPGLDACIEGTFFPSRPYPQPGAPTRGTWFEVRLGVPAEPEVP